MSRSIAKFWKRFECELVELNIDELRDNCSDVALGVPRLFKLPQHGSGVNTGNCKAGPQIGLI